jgi:hypothetical protein
LISNIGGRFANFLLCWISHSINSLLPKSGFVKLFNLFFCFEKFTSLSFTIYFYLQMYFWAGYTTSYVGMYPKKQGGILVLAGLGPCCQTVGTLLRTPWQQSWQKNLAKTELGEFTWIKKYTQLFFIERIWQSQKFDKPLPIKITWNGWKILASHFLY